MLDKHSAQTLNAIRARFVHRFATSDIGGYFFGRQGFETYIAGLQNAVRFPLPIYAYGSQHLMRLPRKPGEHFGCLGFGFRFAENVVLIGDRSVGGQNRIFGRRVVCGKPLLDSGGIFSCAIRCT